MPLNEEIYNHLRLSRRARRLALALTARCGRWLDAELAVYTYFKIVNSLLIVNVFATLDTQHLAASAFLTTTHLRKPSHLGTAQSMSSSAAQAVMAHRRFTLSWSYAENKTADENLLAVGITYSHKRTRVTLTYVVNLLYCRQATIARRIFFMAFFSSWRTRSAETPYRSASSCSVLLLSSSSQRARMMSWLRSSRTFSAALSLSAA